MLILFLLFVPKVKYWKSVYVGIAHRSAAARKTIADRGHQPGRRWANGMSDLKAYPRNHWGHDRTARKQSTIDAREEAVLDE